MIDKKYARAFSEVREVLKNTDEELVNKIPKSFKNFIEENYDKDYQIAEINVNKKLDEQGLLDDTLTIISLIYRNYWCDEKQRKEYDEIIKENERKYQEEIREKYNPDKLFKKNNIEEVIVQENNNIDPEIQKAITEYKAPVFKRIWLKIKNILKIS